METPATDQHGPVIPELHEQNLNNTLAGWVTSRSLTLLGFILLSVVPRDNLVHSNKKENQLLYQLSYYPLAGATEVRTQDPLIHVSNL